MRLLKWNAPGDPRRRYVKLQGEYMHRTEDGSLAFDTTGAALADGYGATPVRLVRAGCLPVHCRAGVRACATTRWIRVTPDIGLVDSGALTERGLSGCSQSADPRRTSVMVDWNLSEFSRLRAQFAWDDARDAATDEQLFLQYIYSLGAHGAHKF